MKLKSVAFLLLSLVCLSVVSEPVTYAYVLPAEQIVGFMASNFSKTQTLIIHQFCQEAAEEETGGSDEVLTMKSPDRFQLRMKDSGEKKETERDYAYQQLFLANSPPRLLALMQGMGINLGQVGYTRIDGVIAYRIGDAEEASPKVLVEKRRFLPLLISYKGSGPGVTSVKAKFLDYRKVTQAWYPFKILYTRADGTTENCMVRSLKVNGPVSPSLFGSK